MANVFCVCGPVLDQGREDGLPGVCSLYVTAVGLAQTWSDTLLLPT
jgi:hypothetical protein